MITIPGKIPITIQPLFWLLAIFIGWMSTFTLMGTVLAVVVIVVSVLFHEFGHALTALFFKQKVRIELAVFGGFTYREGKKLKLWKEFLVVLNGPLAGFLLGCIAYVIYTKANLTNPSLIFLFKFTALANFFWTIINLIPLLPLDGGHLLSIVLEAIFGFRGVKLAIIIGLVVGVSLSVFFFIVGAYLIGAIFLLLTFESFRSWRYYKMMNEKDRDSSYQDLLRSAESDLEHGKVDQALEKFEEIRSKTKGGVIYTIATQELARVYKHQDKYKEAYDLLFPLKKSLSGDTLTLFHYLAYKNKDYKTAAEISDQTFQHAPSHEVAAINAFSFAALKQPEPAIGWLECALREGLPSVKEAISKKEFDPIRNDPKFVSFVETHA